MRFAFFASLVLLAAPAAAQTPQPPAGQDDDELVVDVTGGQSRGPLSIAIPVIPTAATVQTAAGTTDQLGRQLSDIIRSDLKNSGLFTPLAADRTLPVAFGDVTQPQFDSWSSAGASSLVQGYIKANGDGTLTVGCYLYDVAARSELTRQGFIVPPSEWRRAGHKCADAIYQRLTGEGPYFDSRVVYVSETGPKARRIKRLAIMDQDGANHRFLTNGQTIVLTPRFSPDQRSVVYLSYANDRPSVFVLDLASGRQRLIVPNVNLNFAPRFSPDGRWILFSMAIAGDTDLYRVAAGGGASPQRLTASPGIDTGGSYSPDGSKIVFESDRSGAQQLYVMNADGSNPQRISFGGGGYATPAWSPRGDLIAYTKTGSFRIGVMTPGGGAERLLTNAWQDEGPSWSPNGRVVMFFRQGQGGGGRADLWSVDLTGVNERKVPTALDGSDPNWGPLRP
ncbi:MAG: Tol-Pal system beta propeller repeat protein TolB [Pseudomonadota bacterium]